MKRKSKKLSRKLGHVFAEKRKLRPEKRKLRRGFGSKAKFGRKSAEIRTFCGGLGPLRPKSTTLPEHNVGIATPSPGPLQNGPLSTTSHLEKNESFTKVRTHVPRKAKRKLGTFKTKVCPTPRRRRRRLGGALGRPQPRILQLASAGEHVDLRGRGRASGGWNADADSAAPWVDHSRGSSSSPPPASTSSAHAAATVLVGRRVAGRRPRHERRQCHAKVGRDGAVRVTRDA